MLIAGWRGGGRTREAGRNVDDRELRAGNGGARRIENMATEVGENHLGATRQSKTKNGNQQEKKGANDCYPTFHSPSSDTGLRVNSAPEERCQVDSACPGFNTKPRRGLRQAPPQA